MGTLYLVTGAAGHLGNIIVHKLRKAGHPVRALVVQGEQNVPDCEEVIYGDVRDKESLRAFFANPEGRDLIVIHAAGIVSIASKYDQNVYDVNVEGTKNIVRLCVENKVKKLVYVSSVHAIPEKPAGQTIAETTVFSPDLVNGLYAKTKAEATAYVLSAGDELDVSVVHPSGICGPYDHGRGHLTALVTDYCNGGLTSVVRGGYDFVDARDVADGIILCCEKGRRGECYILSNRYFSVQEIISELHEVTGKREIKSVLPNWFAMITAPLAELYYKILRKPPLYTTYSLYTLKSNSLFSHEKADRELGYRVTNIRKTLADTVEWLMGENRIKQLKGVTR
jgi:dihydroflavonol-4-reductase